MATNDLQLRADEYYMRLALKQARMAYALFEVPVGAVIVDNKSLSSFDAAAPGEVLSAGYNRRETEKNGLCHAELAAIDIACRKLSSWRLNEVTLYVTLEPCPMCMGAVINTRISRVVFGASDYKSGACGSVLDLASYRFNHVPEVVSGVLEEECAGILREFFARLRKK